MSGDLRAGSLHIGLSVSTKQLTSGLDKALKSVTRFGESVKGMGEKVQASALIATGALAGIAAAASKSMPEMKRAMDSVSKSGQEFAAALGPSLLPVVQKLDAVLQGLLARWKALSPELQQGIVYALSGAAAFGLFASVMGKAGAALSAMASAGTLLLDSSKSIIATLAKIQAAGWGAMVPLIKLVAVVAAAAAVAGVLRKVWADHGDSIKATLSGVVDKLQEWGRMVAGWFGDLWASVKTFLMKGITYILDQYALMARSLAKLLRPVADMLGLDGVSRVLERMETLTGGDLLSGIKDGASFVADKVVSAASTLAHAGKVAAEYIGDGLKLLVADVKGLVSGLGGGSGPRGGPGTGAPKISAAPPVEITNAYNVMKRGFELRMKEINAAEIAASLQGVLKNVAKAIQAADKRFEQDQARAKLRTEFVGGVDRETGQASGLVGQALGQLGTAGSVASGVMQGAAVAGPWGAMAGGAMALLGETQALESLMGALQPVLDVLVGVLDAVLMPVVKALEPVFATVAAVMGSLTPVLEIFGMGLQALDPVIKGVSWVIIKVQEGISHVINWLIDAAAWFVELFNREAGEQLRAKRVDTAALAKAAEDLWKPAEKITDEMAEAAGAVSSANLPAAWKQAQRVFESADYGRVPGAAARQQPVVVHSHLYLDGKEVATSVNRVNQDRATQRSGVVRRAPVRSPTLPGGGF